MAAADLVEAMGSAVVVSTEAVGGEVMADTAMASDWQASVTAIMAAITATDTLTSMVTLTATGILTAMPATAAATWLGSA